MYNYRKRFIIKNIVYITVILLIAIFSTYKIYYKFQDDRDTNYNSKSFVVTFHEKTGYRMTLDKVTPVTDSVGLSSKSYTLSIKNNLTEKVPFKIRISDDIKTIDKDRCSDALIPEEDIRISIKNGSHENEIYTLSELKDGILLSDYVKALETRELAIRVWVSKDSTLPMNSNLHYHGLIEVLEEDNTVAINRWEYDRFK